MIDTWPPPTVDEKTGRREPIYADALIAGLITTDDEEWSGPKIREHIRPSKALSCARQLGYDTCGMPGRPMGHSGVFNTKLGKILHKLWQLGIEAEFEAMRNTKGAMPQKGVPWRVEVEQHFSRQEIILPNGKKVIVEGYADLVVYDGEDNVLEVVDAKSKGGYGFKMDLKNGADYGAVIQSWSYSRLLGAPPDSLVAVMDIAKECVSVNETNRLGVSENGRFVGEYQITQAEVDADGFAELNRMGGIVALVHEQGFLPRRTIPGEGNGTEITAPMQGMFDDGTKTPWKCDYCDHREQCIKDGPGRVPLPAESLLAIRNAEQAAAS